MDGKESGAGLPRPALEQESRRGRANRPRSGSRRARTTTGSASFATCATSSAVSARRARARTRPFDVGVRGAEAKVGLQRDRRLRDECASRGAEGKAVRGDEALEGRRGGGPCARWHGASFSEASRRRDRGAHRRRPRALAMRPRRKEVDDPAPVLDLWVRRDSNAGPLACQASALTS